MNRGLTARRRIQIARLRLFVNTGSEIAYIHRVNVTDLDLNLLAVFDAVWRLKNVSQAAAAVGLSQPAASNAIRRLRGHFGDRLFVRTADGMLPTPLAEQLGPVVSGALAQIQQGLQHRREFNPQKESRTYTLIMTDIGEIVFLPPLLQHLREEAPGISIRTVQLSAAEAPRALQSGAVDLAIGFMPDLKTGVYQQLLFTTEYVCIVRRDHPTIRDRMTRPQFIESTHAVAEETGTGHYVVEQELERLGVRRRIGLRVPHFLALPTIVASCDMVATVPEPLASAFLEAVQIKILAHPIRFPELAIKQFWHERYHDDPANRGVAVPDRF
jgi:DNA-binding transcriptional LysR family regulator